ncbi:MAG: NADH-quinone oxidoreductase subunit L [bacterium]
MPEKAFNLIWLVPLLPLFGFLFNAFLGKRVGRTVVAWVGPAVVLAACAVSVYILMALLRLPQDSQLFIRQWFTWIDVGNLNIPFEFRIDPLSMLMCLVVTGVGGLIHIYATGYMADDPDFSRFFTYFNLFIAFMLTLVLANNLLVMFIGWEGVGLCSYLLISFWYKDLVNARSGNKAFIVNRIGDVGFLLGIFALFTLLTSSGIDGRVLSFDILSKQAMDVFRANPGWTTTIALLFLLGATGKSAQLPLYFWLPDAMAGPTPVSALIHAATMVTAGVFLLSRMHFLFELSQVAMLTVAIVGASTAFFAATIAIGQTDIKKVLAFSTVSQIGFMFLACGAGAFNTGMFHVTTHAFFKALLFLAAGSVILAMHHAQDMRHFGALAKPLKITYWTTMCAWLAIAGIFPFAGYYSKDEILAKTLSSPVLGTDAGHILYWVALITALLTAFYMTRMMGLTFWDSKRWEKSSEPKHGVITPHEPGWSILFPLVALAILCAVGGWALANHGAIDGFLASATSSAEAPAEEVNVSSTALGVAVLGILMGLALYARRFPKFEKDLSGLFGLQRLASKQWGYDWFMTNFLGLKVGSMVGTACAAFDTYVIDGAVNGVAKVFGGLSLGFRRAQTGYVRSYAFVMLFGVICILVAVYFLGFRR